MRATRDRARAAERLLQKRSFTLSGHRTSVALEPEFWAVLEAAAHANAQALAALVAEIDRRKYGIAEIVFLKLADRI